jgi:RNA polymerase sigma-70 factor (ECF subfamily)
VGAEWAWRQVYEDLAPRLLRYHRARGTTDPEDLVGDTFVRVVRGLPTFDWTEEQFRAWVFQISRRRAADLGRSARRRPAEPVPADDLVGRGPKGDTEDDAIRSLEGERVRAVLGGSRRTSGTCSCSASFSTSRSSRWPPWWGGLPAR